MIEIKTDKKFNMPSILVVGIGGAGNNAVDRMIEADLSNVTFATINTDLQDLDESKAPIHIQIGTKLTGGLGAGSNPEIGAASAKENEEDIEKILTDVDMAILTCGLGGGTGTGAIPVIAEMCKSRGILTVAVVTTPFTFEGSTRAVSAALGLEKLKKNVDTLLVIPNDKLLTLKDKAFYLEDAFPFADSVLKYTIQSITNIVFNKGTINLDFNDLKTTLENKGTGHLGIGVVPNDGSLIEAVQQAIKSPLLDTTIAGATNVLINSSGKINLIELNQAISMVQEMVGENVNLIWGTVNDPSDDDIVVTIIATGMEEHNLSGTELKNLNSSSEKAVSKEVKSAKITEPVEIVIPSFLDVYKKSIKK